MNGSIPLLLKAGVLTLAVAAAWDSSLFLTVFAFLFCLLPTEQIFQNLRQEYSRIQRRRQLEGAFNQTEACSSSDAPSPSSSLNAPSSPPGRFTALHTHTAWGFNSALMRLHVFCKDTVVYNLIVRRRINKHLCSAVRVFFGAVERYCTCADECVCYTGDKTLKWKPTQTSEQSREWCSIPNICCKW